MRVLRVFRIFYPSILWRGILHYTELFLRFLPDLPHASILRILFYKSRGLKIGTHCFFAENVSLYTPDKIEIGHHVGIGRNCIIDPIPSTIKIGNDVLIAANCYIRAGNHGFKDADTPIRTQEFEAAPIVIEDDVWVGANVTLLKGVTLGRGSIISAGSVVMTDVPPYAIVSGVPARVVSWRKEPGPNQI